MTTKLTRKSEKTSFDGAKRDDQLGSGEHWPDLLIGIHGKMKSGNYDEDLVASAKKMYQLLQSEMREDASYWEAVFIAYEVLDYADDPQADRVIAKGKDVYAELSCALAAAKKERNEGWKMSLESALYLQDALKHDRQLIREKIRVSLAWANAEFYRKNDFAQALKIIDDLKQCLDEVVSDSFPCWATMAMLQFFKARVLKQCGDLKASLDCIGYTIELYHRRAEYKAREHKKTARMRMSAQFSANRIAAALTTMAWIHTSQGSLRQALCEAVSAKFILEETGDWINKGFVRLLLGRLTRALAGSDKVKIEEAILYVDEAIAIFEKYFHDRLLHRAIYEKAAALYNLRKDESDLNEALRLVGIVSSFAAERKNLRWQANCLVLKSRIKRRQGELKYDKVSHEEAVNLASKAIEFADQGKQSTCKLEALIVRGSVRINQGKHDVAQRDLKDARKLLLGMSRTNEGPNARLSALINLQLARSCAENRDLGQASQYLSEFGKVENKVEHGGVRELAVEVRKLITAMERGFVIPRLNPDDPNSGEKLKYYRILADLQKYLLDEVGQITTNQTKQGEILGVTRQTIQNWQSQS